jgi:aspartyl-tRNA(Asn)/glutamyl-tRNA(Gln) amidotransferase subunit C
MARLHQKGIFIGIMRKIIMAVTIAEVERIAALAKLSFTDEEKARFTEQFNQILAHVDKLNELDLTDVEPTSHVLMGAFTLREDEIRPSLSPDEALANAPRRNRDYFSVPKVIGS